MPEKTKETVSMVSITLNGEARQVGAANLAELMRELALDARRVAVERNLTIVPKSAYAATALSAGDAIEIVEFIGGG